MADASKGMVFYVLKASSGAGGCQKSVTDKRIQIGKELYPTAPGNKS